jgi:hypothetical protein
VEEISWGFWEVYPDKEGILLIRFKFIDNHEVFERVDEKSVYGDDPMINSSKIVKEIYIPIGSGKFEDKREMILVKS